MRKRHWLIGPLAVMALVLGLGSATVLAQESKSEDSRTGIIARVAAILGLEEQQVQDAFDQARQELRDERFEAMVGQRLEALVESGRITQEQADELGEWYASRPDSFWLTGEFDRGKKGHTDRGHKSGARRYSAKAHAGKMPAMSPQQLAQHLDALVASGRLTQEQADRMRDQYATHTRGFHFGSGYERGKGHGWQRSHGPHFQRGFFYFRGYMPAIEDAAPAMPTTAPGSATPTAPADSSDSN